MNPGIKRPYSKILRKYNIENFEDYVFQYQDFFCNDIVKEPGLTFEYYDLKRCFPNAKFVIIVREPKDNIRSILDRLKIPGNLENLIVNDWPELKKSPAWQINLDSCWLDYCSKSYIDSLAYRWKLSSDTYLKNKNDFILFKYEDFLANKKDSIEKLSYKLSLPVKNDITSYVDKQYQPKGNKINNYKKFYGDNLKYIEEHCIENSKKLGY
ncbi:sulfotransferase [Marinospirillum insulare]|uniref:Sulfotransferase domain-containing protein n=1 Tax=Marinospirillum insulare TaxID=217169 RepID=A0ABQ5ZUH9_9GAMM|nr:sulfotransferase [Marinospirillum insulare]GLR63062.1 hypothetical protein GCM10007878_04970 [Marinospirillum insulare]